MTVNGKRVNGLEDVRAALAGKQPYVEVLLEDGQRVVMDAAQVTRDGAEIEKRYNLH